MGRECWSKEGGLLLGGPDPTGNGGRDALPAARGKAPKTRSNAALSRAWQLFSVEGLALDNP
jgi:hypothetical protein